jgi:hypothetical protein
MGATGVSFKMRKRRETGKDSPRRGQRRGAAGFRQSFPCTDLDGYSREALRPPTPLLRGLTHHLKLVTRQRFLGFSILKETPAAPQAFLVSLCPVTPLVVKSQPTGGAFPAGEGEVYGNMTMGSRQNERYRTTKRPRFIPYSNSSDSSAG